MDADEDFLLVDVREQNEYEIVSIPGSVLIPKGDILSGEALSSLPMDKPLVLHCKSGARSAEALAVLHKAGFADAVHVGGGVLGLGQAGRPEPAVLLSHRCRRRHRCDVTRWRVPARRVAVSAGPERRPVGLVRTPGGQVGTG